MKETPQHTYHMQNLDQKSPSAEASSWQTSNVKSFGAKIITTNNFNSLIVLIGVLVRVRQYAAGASLWLDELFLATNLTSRSYAGLTTKLDDNQAAPIGFLWLEKFLGEITNYSEYGLRVIPLLAGCSALILLRNLAVKLRCPLSISLSLALVSFDPELIRYSCELKQYSLDLALSVLLMSELVKNGNHFLSYWSIVKIGSLGAVAIWFSHPAIFIMVATGIVWTVDCLRSNARWKVHAPILIVWAISICINYFLFLRDQSSNRELRQMWQTAFLPLPPRSLSDLLWTSHVLTQFLNRSGSFMFPGLGLATACIGSIVLGRRQPRFVCLLLLPVLLALLASSLGKYPFMGRLIIFLMGFVSILVAQGAVSIAFFSPKNQMFVLFVLVLLLVGRQTVRLPVTLLRSHPIASVREAMEYVAKNRLKDDQVYLYFRFLPAWKFYSSRLGLSAVPVIVGVTPTPGPLPDEVDRCNRELTSIDEHRRVWLLFTNTILAVEETFETERYLTDSLNKLRIKVECPSFPGAEVFLYSKCIIIKNQ